MNKRIKKALRVALPIAFLAVAGAASASWGQYSPMYNVSQPHYRAHQYQEHHLFKPWASYNYSPYRSNYYDYYYATGTHYSRGDLLGGLIVDNLNLVSQFRYFPPTHTYLSPIFYSPYSIFNYW